jgi:hypothetical protein
MVDNLIINYKKRKNYSDCSDRHQITQKKLIQNQSEQLCQFSQSIGLKINEIILSPEDNNDCKPKVTVLQKDYSEKEFYFKFTLF